MLIFKGYRMRIYQFNKIIIQYEGVTNLTICILVTPKSARYQTVKTQMKSALTFQRGLHCMRRKKLSSEKYGNYSL